MSIIGHVLLWLPKWDIFSMFLFLAHFTFWLSTSFSGGWEWQWLKGKISTNIFLSCNRFCLHSCKEDKSACFQSYCWCYLYTCRYSLTCRYWKWNVVPKEEYVIWTWIWETYLWTSSVLYVVGNWLVHLQCDMEADIVLPRPDVHQLTQLGVPPRTLHLLAQQLHWLLKAVWNLIWSVMWNKSFIAVCIKSGKILYYTNMSLP